MTQALVSGGSGSIDRLLVRCRRGLEGRLVRVHLRIEAAAELVAALRAEPVRCGLTHWQRRATAPGAATCCSTSQSRRVCSPSARAVSAPRPPARGRPSMPLGRPESLCPSPAQARRHY